MKMKRDQLITLRDSNDCNIDEGYKKNDVRKSHVKQEDKKRKEERKTTENWSTSGHFEWNNFLSHGMQDTLSYRS